VGVVGGVGSLMKSLIRRVEAPVRLVAAVRLVTAVRLVAAVQTI
jgi:hypothetical protein